MPTTLKRALCIVGATIAIGAFNIREAHADATDLSIGQWQELGAFFTGDVFNAIGIEKVESNGKTFIVAGASCTTPGPEYREDICMVAYDADTFELADFGDPEWYKTAQITSQIFGWQRQWRLTPQTDLS